MRFSVNSNTTQQLNFNELLEKVVGSGVLPQNKMRLFSYIAELISNVYEHATSDQQSSVDWYLSIYHENNELFLTIHDNGQGIESSLKNKQLSADEPLRFAVESCVGNRGQGLRSIYEATKAGTLSSFKVSSGNSSYQATRDSTSIEKLGTPFEGVLVTLSLNLEANYEQ
ncbi:hypothetical protein ACPV5J_23505 [Vibrio rotiferianus]|uniref:hypothetical protein n=1 Tax=Vibrio rotiferianus TaxID=190895 RepID=UPI00406A6C9B